MKKNARSKKYQVVGLGGTFDHFHQGHAWFLEQAAQLSELLIIGITTDELLDQKAFIDTIENYETREAAVAAFLRQRDIEFELVPLADVAGPAFSDKRIEAVVLTDETASGGEQINKLRLAAGFKALPLERVAMQKGENTDFISSKYIREGSHNRRGAAYRSLLTELITLSETQRRAMREVQGILVDMPNPTDTTRYLVGDSTLRRFLKEDYQYSMAILDGKEQRTTYYPLVIDKNVIDLIVENPAGSITPMLVNGLVLALRQKLVHIFVDGEEDLAAAVLQLLLPLGSTIYYGQPNAGLVRWPVTEHAKEKTAVLLNPHFQTNPKLVE